MYGWKRMVLATVLVGALAGGVLSQEQEGGGPSGRQGGRGGGRGNWQQMMQQRMKEYIGASDEQWEEMEPLIERVQELSTQVHGDRSVLFRGMWGGGRGRGPAEQEAEEEQSPVEKATEALQQVLEDDASEPEQIQQSLDALREARQEVAGELQKEREKLREMADIRQQARMVLLGLLD
ncbi:MAG: hypothetical protein R6V05_00995 [Candidatus Brocadiia bacterium]